MDSKAPSLAVPPPDRVVEVFMSDGAIVRLRRHGNPRGPRLALSHGNGLAIDGYLPFWGRLLDRYDLILFDQRNHGQNPLHGAQGHEWHQMVDDMERIFRAIQSAFGAKATVGAFHSLSAVAAVKHHAAHGPRWPALVLFDPPIFPRPGHPLQPLELEHMRELTARALRRPERYAHPSRLARQFAAAPLLRNWVPGAHLLMAEATLRYEPATRDWRLACPRELEAHTFETNVDPTVWDQLSRVAVPVTLIAGDPELAGQQPPALICRAIADETSIPYQSVEGTSHFLQIERPEECIRAMERFLADHALVA